MASAVTSSSSSSFCRALCALPCPSDASDAAVDLIKDRLRAHLDIDSDEVTAAAAATKRRSATARALIISRTPGRELGGQTSARSRTQRIFGRPIRDLSMVYVQLSKGDDAILVPKVLSVVCSRLEGQLGQEGLFRKAGSSCRQRQLREALESASPDGWTDIVGAVDVSTLDVAAILKQWLRELPEPLIPKKYQKLFIECLKRHPESSPKRIESLLLSTCLLPQNHAATLIYLSRFFASVADRSDDNKMDWTNLAIVLAPTLFPVEQNGGGGSGGGFDMTGSKSTSTTPGPAERMRKKGGATGSTAASSVEELALKTEVVKCLFQNADGVGILPAFVEEALTHLQSPSNSFFASGAAAAAATEDADYEPVGVGPMERRRKKKQKRRSASLSRVLTATVKGLQKAMSRSTTPTRAGSSFYNDSTAAASFHCTPLPNRKASSSSARGPSSRSAAPFTSPRLPAKRKAATAAEKHECSPNSKQQRTALPPPAHPVSHTPKMRGRPFAVKKKFSTASKTKDETCSSGGASSVAQPESSPQVSSMQLLSFSPLPNKPAISLSLATPGSHLTDADFPLDGTDIKTPAEDEVDANSESMSLDKTSASTKTTTTPIASEDDERKEGSAKSNTSRSSARSGANMDNSGCASPAARRESRSSSRRPSMRNGERRQRSPSERKIGIVRRRSQEMQARLERQRRQQQEDSSTAAAGKVQTNKPSLTNAHLKEMRNQLGIRSGFNHVSFKAATPVKPMSRSAAASSATGASTGLDSSESLTNLRHDISSFIEKSFGDGEGGEVASTASSKNNSSCNVSDLVSKLEISSNRLPSASGVQTRAALMRRQSSAFEFSRNASDGGSAGSSSMAPPPLRRQSSAFEVAERNRQRGLTTQQPVYENFSRGMVTRASLKRRNSSVKDLMKKFESRKKEESPPPLPARKRNPSISEAAAFEAQEQPASGAAAAEEWMDAEEFFKNPLPPAPLPASGATGSRVSALPRHFTQDDALTSGCKRSSIIKIRQENRGKVIKSVETFTKPQQHGDSGTNSLKNTPAGGTRRLSARMGVATTAALASSTATASGNKTSASSRTSAAATTAHKAPLATPRRQTLTGIRTSYKSPLYENVAGGGVGAAHKRRTSNNFSTPSSAAVGNNRKKTPTASRQRVHTDENAGARTPESTAILSKRAGGVSAAASDRRKSKRFLTIGYAGEAVARSPLMERQNIVVTVQRSKSAQTPVWKATKPKQNKVSPRSSPAGSDHSMVRRSHSLRCTPDRIVVPPELRETIYDVTTPKSEKVKRHLSDRIVSSGSNRKPRRPLVKRTATTAGAGAVTAVGRRTVVFIEGEQQVNVKRY